MENSKRDENFCTVAMAVTDDTDQDLYMILVDPVTLELEAELISDTILPASTYKNAQRDQNHRTVCLGYNELTGETEEILTDENGYLLAQLT